MRPWILVLVLSGLVGCRTVRPEVVEAPRETLLEISHWEDQRVAGGGRLRELARSHSHPVVRARAVRALGRLQDEAVSGVLVEALQDADESVKREAIFAIGQLGLSWHPLPSAQRSRLALVLIPLDREGTSLSLRQRVLQALGKLATPEALNALQARLGTLALRSDAAWALGLAAKRGTTLPPGVVTAVTPFLRTPDAAQASAYALAFSKQREARPGLLEGLGHPDATVRAFCARGLVEVGELPDAPALGRAMADVSSGVAVEATRALARLAARCVPGLCAPLEVLRGVSSRPALLALAQQPLPPAARPLLEALRAPFTARAATNDDDARLDCRLAAALDGLAGVLIATQTCGAGKVPDSLRLSWALGQMAQAPSRDRTRLFAIAAPYLHHASSAVRLAAVEAVAESGSAAAGAVLLPLLSESDVVVVGAAAEALGRLGTRQAVPLLLTLAPRVRTEPDLAEGIAGALGALKAAEAVPALNTWLSSNEASVRHVAAAALERITGAPASFPPRAAAGPSSSPPPGDGPQGLRVRTRRGEIHIRFFRDDAPRTAATLAALARKGFYRGLTFHRIVPNFVAQGGDPRGDGSGGPGFRIRCEISPQPYRRGTVGMALSGKDTGGSQFFLTLSPQPHLEGRYTVVGEVVRGDELLDGLLEGEVIDDVDLL